ncbi:hypothetical protein AV530_002313 [Patagioenas fasciata monilis]|uniref:Uncharacterized protein n=1 Tax=Patagioenas fasciata monilis TaxID=372326 RepID=A0A1V4K7I2_PATFA|nr:hypothetical protein AV530_002313 [Patagioenas fasciata monilis]
MLQWLLGKHLLHEKEQADIRVMPLGRRSCAYKLHGWMLTGTPVVGCRTPMKGAFIFQVGYSSEQSTQGWIPLKAFQSQ